VDNYVENLVHNSHYLFTHLALGDINSFIIIFFVRFPLFFAEKRYKLINFAPEMEIVDKLS
jgi:hypothetical protein